ncbi:hypothetical protein [Acinetobacter larvae]|uniref:Cation transporter n=1 Tax=Acinetobacter larvae TaxID=1789224 RepID=A0A1B2M2Q9_9GAMM|nr:hypothetical protein [Acinetobacter larvae]AOA59459.1 hypothetical protein BFG52_14620 [Acinetobacter larvae]
MKSLAIWVSILLSLLMFQSVWNMAAAFCVHQSAGQSQRHQPHFGHHSSYNCQHTASWQQQDQQLQRMLTTDKTTDKVVDSATTDPTTHSTTNSITIDVDGADLQSKIQFLFDDHQDHAPSFAHYVVVAQQDIDLQRLELPSYPQQFYWENLYQSPALKRPVPPPTVLHQL